MSLLSDLGALIGTKLKSANVKLDAEISRATTAEGVIDSSLSNEVARATTAEGNLGNEIDFETLRATTAEGTLATNLTTEVTRATSAESTLTTNLSNETTARIAGDNSLQTNINTVAADRYTKIETYTKVEVEDRFNNVLDITNGLNLDKVGWTKYNEDMTIIEGSLGDILAAQEVVQIKTKAYLNGGYKSSVVQQKRCQRFSSVTETGGDLGYIANISSSYRPGGTSKDNGYFFGSPTVTGTSSTDGKSVDMITYLSESISAVTSGGLSFSVYGTLYDINLQTTIYGNDAAGNWLSIATDTNTIATLAVSTTASHSRQMLSSETFGLAKNATSTQYKYDYTTNVSAVVGSAFTVTNIPAGLVKDKTEGYWVGYTTTNFKVDMTTFAHTQVNSYTVNFGESNTLGTETHGYALGGYSGVQHGIVQKFDWATETGSTVLGGDLSYEQSSAGCAEA